MARMDMNRIGKAAPLLASLLAALCAIPAWAQTPGPQPETAFGQEMPKQYLINRLTNPSRETIEQTAREDAESKPTYSRAPDKAPPPVDAGKPTYSRAPDKAPPPSEAGNRPASSEAANRPASSEAANNGDYYDPYPRQFLINRLLGSGGQ